MSSGRVQVPHRPQRSICESPVSDERRKTGSAPRFVSASICLFSLKLIRIWRAAPGVIAGIILPGVVKLAFWCIFPLQND